MGEREPIRNFINEKPPIRENRWIFFDKKNKLEDGVVWNPILNEIFEKNKINENREIKPAEIFKIRERIFDKAGIRLDRREFELPSSTLGGLAGLVEKYSQTNADGNIRYLVTAGLAVEAITGYSRLHHDTDLVICDPTDDWWKKLLTDNVTPDKYWADMSFPEGYLEDTAWPATIRVNGRYLTVLTVHPAILLVQKSSNAWGRQPREKDYKDVAALVAFWKKHGEDPSWFAVSQKALEALPTAAERTIAKMRLKDAHFPV